VFAGLEEEQSMYNGMYVAVNDQVGGQKQRVVGWTETGDLVGTSSADWSHDISREGTIQTSPVPASDCRRLFVGGQNPSVLLGLDSATGEELLELPTPTSSTAQPVVTPSAVQPQVVYNVQAADGRIYAFSQETGTVLWQGSCDDFYMEDCANSVRAEFTVAEDALGRLVLYYGDVAGRLSALRLTKVTEDGDNTPVIGNSPLDPFVQISQEAAYDNTNPGQSSISYQGSIGGAIGLAVVAGIVILVGLAYVVHLQRRKLVNRLEAKKKLKLYPAITQEEEDEYYSPQKTCQSSPASNVSRAEEGRVGAAPSPLTSGCKLILDDKGSYKKEQSRSRSELGAGRCLDMDDECSEASESIFGEPKPAEGNELSLLMPMKTSEQDETIDGMLN